MLKIGIYIFIGLLPWSYGQSDPETPFVTTGLEIPPQIHKMEILEPIPIQNVYGRERLQLKCSTSGYPVPTIEWSLNGVIFKTTTTTTGDGTGTDTTGTDIDTTGVDRHTITEGKFLLEKINGVTDTGRYRCIATNVIGSVFVEKFIRIRVMGKFKIGSQYHNQPSKLLPTIGRKFIINCPPHSFGYGTKYKWGVVPKETREPQYWAPSIPSARAFPVSGGKWAYSFVTDDDMKQSRNIGGIRCILVNFGLYEASNQQLLWQYYERVEESRKPDLIQHMPANMVAKLNTEYTMSCGALGKPKPEYTWSYQGVDVHSRWNNGSNELNFEFFRILAGGHILKLRRVTRYSGGTFKCTATNKLGKTWKIGQLMVQQHPKFLSKMPISQVVPVGTPWSFNCSATGVPTPHYEWYHNGSMLETNLYRTVEGGVITINEARYVDDGIYICLAINVLETLTDSTYIQVKSTKPVFKIALKDAVYIYQKSIRFIDCLIVGGPIPVITWFKDGTALAEKERFTTYTNGTLRINDVEMEDSGTYRCLGENANGKVEDTSIFKVLERVSINRPPQNITFSVGWGYGMLYCGATYDKMLDLRIDWYKGGVKMAKFDSRIYLEPRAYGPPRVLHINDFRITDGGIYSCHAFTEIGELVSDEWAYATITIKGPPQPPAGVYVDGDCLTGDATLRWTRGEELSVETRRFFIEYATNKTYADNLWFGGEGPPRLQGQKLMAEPGTITYFDLTKERLVPGANLIFRVRGASDFLTGNPSRITEFGTCITPPGKPIVNPMNVTVSHNGSGKFVIVWKPVPDVYYGSPDFYYRVSYKKLVDETYTQIEIRDPLANSFEVASPGIYQPYSFYVQSMNSLGEGPVPQIMTNFSGRPKPLRAPGNVRVTLVLKFTVEFRYSSVPDADGYKITYWNISDSESQRGYTPNEGSRKRREVISPYVYKSQMFNGIEFSNGVSLLNLTADQDFMATVRAVNSGGEGPESPVIEFTTAQRVPNQPIRVYFKTFGKSARLSWNPPLGPNGFVEGYTVYWYTTDPNDNSKNGDIHSLGFDRGSREAYLVNVFTPLTYYNIKLSARNRVGPGADWERLLVAVSAPDIPGKPNAPLLRPFDDTSINVTFQNSWYGGLPTKFLVRVRPKEKYYEDYVIYEQAFPQRAWILIRDLNHVTYDFHCIAVNDMGSSETSDVEEQRPIKRPKRNARATNIAWWQSSWFIMIFLFIAFFILMAITILFLLRKRKITTYKRHKKIRYRLEDEAPLIQEENMKIEPTMKLPNIEINESNMVTVAQTPPPYSEHASSRTRASSRTSIDKSIYSDEYSTDSRSDSEDSFSDSDSYTGSYSGSSVQPKKAYSSYGNDEFI